MFIWSALLNTSQIEFTIARDEKEWCAFNIVKRQGTMFELLSLFINSPILHMMAIQDSSKWKDVMQYLDLAILFLQFAGMQMHTLASQYGFQSRPIRKQFKVFTGFGVFHKFLGFLEFHRFRGFFSSVIFYKFHRGQRFHRCNNHVFDLTLTIPFNKVSNIFKNAWF